jgi:hypothetical protein
MFFKNRFSTKFFSEIVQLQLNVKVLYVFEKNLEIGFLEISIYLVYDFIPENA